MILPVLPDAAMGAIAAASIAGLLTFLGLIIAKENKTSEFRQAWIDSLRLDLSKLISNAREGLNKTVSDARRPHRIGA